MTRGFMPPGKMLRIFCSLYRLKKVPRNLFQHIKYKLCVTGSKSMDKVDMCLFIYYRVVFLVYVDDILFFSPE